MNQSGTEWSRNEIEENNVHNTAGADGCWNCSWTALNESTEMHNTTTNTTEWSDGDLLFTGLTSAVLGVLILATIVGE